MNRAAKLAGFLLLGSVVAVAQIRGTPASVTSMGSGFSQAPGIPASVTSLGRNGFGGVSFGQVPGGQTGRHNFGGNNNFNFNRSRTQPLYVPVYVYGGYGYGYPVVPVYEPHSIDDPVIPPGSSYEPERRGVTIFEPGYRPAAPSSQSDISDSSRYGDHYLDSREDARRSSQDGSSVRVIPGPKTPAPESRRETEPDDESPATVLVFKDGHRVEIHNYAIIGGTLWDLGAHNISKKISLADLNLDATVKANDENGVPFKLPRKG